MNRKTAGFTLLVILLVIVLAVLLACTTETVSTLTREEELVIEMQHNSSQSASSPDQCGKILRTEPWCSVVKSAVRITRPEWEELFPHTEFYVVKRDVYGGEFGQQQRNLLIVEQDGQRYTAETFDKLLAANDITITDANLERVAKAFALMTLPDYLEEDIVFTEWAEGDRPGRFGKRYNYSATVWAKIQGLRTQWFFRVEDGYLRDVLRLQSEYHVGDYIDIPFEELSPPRAEEYFFRGQ